MADESQHGSSLVCGLMIYVSEMTKNQGDRRNDGSGLMVNGSRFMVIHYGREEKLL